MINNRVFAAWTYLSIIHPDTVISFSLVNYLIVGENEPISFVSFPVNVVIQGARETSHAYEGWTASV